MVVVVVVVVVMAAVLVVAAVAYWQDLCRDCEDGGRGAIKNLCGRGIRSLSVSLCLSSF